MGTETEILRNHLLRASNQCVAAFDSVVLRSNVSRRNLSPHPANTDRNNRDAFEEVTRHRTRRAVEAIEAMECSLEALEPSIPRILDCMEFDSIVSQMSMTTEDLFLMALREVLHLVEHALARRDNDAREMLTMNSISSF